MVLVGQKVKITKFVHSCLLIEHEEKVVLCDPGQFSWESGVFDINALPQLDLIIVTHEHFDHMYVPFITALRAKFTNAPILTTPNAKQQLETAGVAKISIESHGLEKVFSVHKHASLDPLGAAPENIAVHVFDTVTVGGDRHDLEETKAVLALPATAPWGSLMGAASTLQRLKPQFVIPIHDWHWNETARLQAYDRLDTFAKENGITFLRPTDGQPIEVSL